MSECIFCKIGAHQLQAMVVYEDTEILAFRDINPQAPVHILIIPKKHYSSPNDFAEADVALMGKLMLAAKTIARQEKLADRGYRLVMNCGQDGGQSVAHVHLHLIGGRQMSWPPG
ncbi:MAG TPA: histidine triad nucleotide-binding protein [Planctomycetota bacterium]|nr:histidine triad nucleotide-binding protein [Planctomycetota bacterium]